MNEDMKQAAIDLMVDAEGLLKHLKWAESDRQAITISPNEAEFLRTCMEIAGGM